MAIQYKVYTHGHAADPIECETLEAAMVAARRAAKDTANTLSSMDIEARIESWINYEDTRIDLHIHIGCNVGADNAIVCIVCRSACTFAGLTPDEAAAAQVEAERVCAARA